MHTDFQFYRSNTHKFLPASFSEFTRNLKANKPLFLSVSLFVVALSSTVTLLDYKPSFVSNGMVMIKDTALTANYVTSDNYQTTTSPSTSPIINTMALLKTDASMQALWDYFSQAHPEELNKLHIKNQSDWENFFGDGHRFVKYTNPPGTDIINLQFKWNNPVIAKEGLDVVINNFKNQSLQLNQSEQRDRGNYLNEQINDIENRLAATRENIRTIKEKNQIIDADEENSNLARARVDLGANIGMANADMAGKMSQFSGYQQILNMSPKQAVVASAIGRNEVLSKMYASLYELNTDQKSLLTRYTENSVKVQDVDSNIDQTKANIQKELSRTLGTSPDDTSIENHIAVSDVPRSNAIDEMLSAKTEAMELSAKRNVLNHYLQTMNKRATQLNQAEMALSDAQLEESTLNDSLKILKEKALDAQLRESQTLSNIFVIEAPRAPLQPAFPRKSNLLFMDLLMGIAFGMVTVLIKCYQTTKPLLNGKEHDIDTDIFSEHYKVISGW